MKANPEITYVNPYAERLLYLKRYTGLVEEMLNRKQEGAGADQVGLSLI